MRRRVPQGTAILAVVACVLAGPLSSLAQGPGSAFTCWANAGTQVIVRTDGVMDLIGDTLMCTGGPVVPAPGPNVFTITPPGRIIIGVDKTSVVTIRVGSCASSTPPRPDIRFSISPSNFRPFPVTQFPVTTLPAMSPGSFLEIVPLITLDGSAINAFVVAPEKMVFDQNGSPIPGLCGIDGLEPGAKSILGPEPLPLTELTLQVGSDARSNQPGMLMTVGGSNTSPPFERRLFRLSMIGLTMKPILPPIVPLAPQPSKTSDDH